MKLFLHIGTEKTGTTAIQDFIRNNTNKLKQSGLVPLKTFLQNENNLNSRLLTYLFENESDYILDDRIPVPKNKEDSKKLFESILKKELEPFQSQNCNFLMSSEQLSSRLQNQYQVLKLKTFLEKFFNEVEIIIYIREQTSMVKSAYYTSLIAGYIPYFHEFINIHIKLSNLRYNYNLMIKQWEEV